MENEAIKIVEAELKTYCIAHMLDVHDFTPNIEVMSRYVVEYMAHVLTATLRVPGIDVPPRPVVTYPADGWNYFRRWLGLKHKTRTVYVNDTIVLPDVGIPDNMRTLVIREYTNVTN